MPVFNLTSKQKSIVAESLSIARDEYTAGRKGSVVGQIMETNGGDVICEFNFIPHDMAAKIIQILKLLKQ